VAFPPPFVSLAALLAALLLGGDTSRWYARRGIKYGPEASIRGKSVTEE
jgi:hypothetical protein